MVKNKESKQIENLHRDIELINGRSRTGIQAFWLRTKVLKLLEYAASHKQGVSYYIQVKLVTSKIYTSLSL